MKSVAEQSLETLVRSSRLLVCVGTGGVGKTTVAAAIGLRAATLGRRTLVITIDPARRLATALGLARLGSVESEVRYQPFLEEPVAEPAPLEALMLDTQTVFDQLIARVAPNESVRKRILENRVYREVSRAISTSQEYMASEKLYEAWTTGRYDLIVLDTPPLKNAIDFLEAPHRLARFLDQRIIRWFMRPVDAQRMFVGRRFLRQTGALVYRLLGYIFGTEFLGELNEFFLGFEQMTDGCRDRSEAVGKILRSDGTSFVIVCDARPATYEATEHFVSQLRARKMRLAGMVVNLVNLCRVKPYSDASVFDPADMACLKGLDQNWERLRNKLEVDYRRQYRASEADNEGIVALRKLMRRRGFVHTVGRIHEEITDIRGLLRFNRHLFTSQ